MFSELVASVLATSVASVFATPVATAIHLPARTSTYATVSCGRVLPLRREPDLSGAGRCFRTSSRYRRQLSGLGRRPFDHASGAVRVNPSDERHGTSVRTVRGHPVPDRFSPAPDFCAVMRRFSQGRALSLDAPESRWRWLIGNGFAVISRLLTSSGGSTSSEGDLVMSRSARKGRRRPGTNGCAWPLSGERGMFVRIGPVVFGAPPHIRAVGTAERCLVGVPSRGDDLGEA